MADWRDGIPNVGKPKSVPNQQAPVRPPNKPSTSAGGGWRGKDSKRSAERDDDDDRGERNWTGEGLGDTPQTGKLAKTFIVGFLGLAIVGLTIGFVRWVLSNDPRLPLFANVATLDDSYDIGVNPFGEQTVEKLIRLTETQNITTVNLQRNTKDILQEADRLVEDVATSENWLQKYRQMFGDRLSKRWLNKDELKGGGPNGNVTAYFISCYIVRDNPGKGNAVGREGQWMLVTRSGDPYNSSTENANFLVPIKTFLERIASQTSSGKYAWIAFDVKPPTVVTNVADLEFPADAFETALREIEPQLQKRLIITLPCSQSEESWVAPELSNSVFAHFFLEGLATGFGSSKNQVITVKNFEAGLKDRVSNWVEVHRHARQTPYFLMSDEKANPGLFGIAENPSMPKIQGASQTELTDKFKELDVNWNRFSKLSKCAWLEPMLYAKVESQLIQMEELAETNASAPWKKFQNAINGDLGKLEESCRYERYVSLIETKLHSDVFPSRVISERILSESRLQDTPWITSVPWLPNSLSSQGARDGVKSLSRDDRCFQVWTVVERIARSEGATEWDRTFNKKYLQQCLDYLGPLDSGRKMEWLEIQILRILFEEIDWGRRTSELTESNLAKACAQAIRIFSEIQEIAVDANPELSRCIGKETLALDAEFLKGFDWLVANDFKNSFNILKTMEKEVMVLKEDNNLLAKAMSIRDRTFHKVPHLLAYWMRSYRYANTDQDRDDARSEAERLGEIMRRAIQLKDDLGKSPESVRAVVNKNEVSEVAMLLEAAEKSTEAKQNSLMSIEANDQQTIRDYRVVLRYPSLPPNLRSQFHDNLVKFYTQSKASTTASNNQSILSKLPIQNGDEASSSLQPSDLTKLFLAKLGKSLERPIYEQSVQSDSRFQNLDDAPKPISQDSTDAKFLSMYSANYAIRMTANAFGQRAFAKRCDLDKWPWSAPAQFRELNMFAYCNLQSRRLFEARWGDGELDEARLNIKQLYFQRLANPYLEKLREHRPDYELATDLQRWGEDLAAMETNAFEKVVKLDFTAAPISLPRESEQTTNKLGKADARFEIVNSDWPATVAVYLGSRINSLHRRVPESETQAVAIANSNPNQRLSVDVNEIEKQKMILAIRGHYISRNLLRQLPGGQYRLDLDRNLSPPTVRVETKNDNPATVMILLDCSNSMGERFVEAQRCVAQLLDQLAKLHQGGEASFRIGIIVFGLYVTDTGDMDKVWKESKYGNQIFQIPPALASNDHIDMLRSKIFSRDIYFGGCTPLYDAIFTATEFTEGGQSRIIVVSDGLNKTEDTIDGKPYYRGAALSFEKLEAKLKQRKDVSMSIFQFETEAISNREDIIEMNKVKTICKDFRLYKSFEEIAKVLVDSFKKSSVFVVRDEGTKIEGRFNDEIEIPSGIVPFKGVVRVRSFDYQGNPQQTEKAIELTGNEKLKLVYQANLNQLNFIPFSEDTRTFDNRDVSKVSLVETSGLRQDDKLWAVLGKTLKPSHQLSIQVAMQGRDAKFEKEKLVLRPKFLIAKVSTPPGDAKKSLLLADFNYRPSHYPAFEFKDLPWEREGDWQSKGVHFDVWFSQEIPTFARRVKLTIDGGEKLIEDDQIRCRWTAGDVVVEVTPKRSDRYFILCNQSNRVERIYEEGATNRDEEAMPIREVHKFTLPTTPLDSTEILVVRLSDLESSKAQELIHFRCQWNDR